MSFSASLLSLTSVAASSGLSAVWSCIDKAPLACASPETTMVNRPFLQWYALHRTKLSWARTAFRLSDLAEKCPTATPATAEGWMPLRLAELGSRLARAERRECTRVEPMHGLGEAGHDPPLIPSSALALRWGFLWRGLSLDTHPTGDEVRLR